MKMSLKTKALLAFIFLNGLFITNAFAQAETHWQYNEKFITTQLNAPYYRGDSFGAACIAASAAYKNFSTPIYRYDFLVAVKNSQCEVKGTVTNRYDGSHWENIGIIGIRSYCEIDPYPDMIPKVVGATYDAKIAAQTKNECSFYCPAGSIRVGNNYCQPQPCPIQPLTALTGDALAFENGNRVRIDGLSVNMQTALANLQTAVARAGGTLTVTSAWRPQGYQDHLREILTKRNQLSDKVHMKTFPQCATLRASVNAESNAHLLGARVGETSNHTPGNAFDANWSGINDASIDSLARDAGLIRPFPTDDRVHFQLR